MFATQIHVHINQYITRFSFLLQRIQYCISIHHLMFGWIRPVGRVYISANTSCLLFMKAFLIQMLECQVNRTNRLQLCRYYYSRCSHYYYCYCCCCCCCCFCPGRSSPCCAINDSKASKSERSFTFVKYNKKATNSEGKQVNANNALNI